MVRKKLRNIFQKVQQSAASHQKYREILKNIYNETEFEDFEVEFMRCLEIIFMQESAPRKNVYVDRSLEFAATFVVSLTNSKEITEASENEASSNASNSNIHVHPFLNTIILNTLKYRNLDNTNLRYRSCQFVDLILRNIGDDAQIDDDLWNVILNGLLERIVDSKAIVCIQAIRALARLQTPVDNECPVIRAFLGRIYNSSTMIRKEVVELIAPNPFTVCKIVERVRDSEHIVRLAAYRKLAKLGPKMIKLVDRQTVIMSGFNEINEIAKKCFMEDMLPKWLSAYNGDFLKLLRALKVDAFSEDLKRTEVVCKNVLEEFFKSYSLSSIVEYLPIDTNKLIPQENLNYESALYWNILVTYLQKSKPNEDDYLEAIIPDLAPFCIYIDSTLKENLKMTESWKHQEYQHILTNLLKIARSYDLGDEAGRKVLRGLATNFLTNIKLDASNITELILILQKMTPSIDSLTIEICSIVADIREPLVIQSQQTQPSEEMLHEKNFKIAQLKVQINVLQDEKDNAVAICDYEKAASVKRQLLELNKMLEELTRDDDDPPATVRSVKNDSETLQRCLDIFIGILSNPKLKTLTASLRAYKDDFIVPLLKHADQEINNRAFKCIALFCTLDRQLAQEHLKLICSPIVVYRLTVQDESSKEMILTAVAAVSDLMRIYGANIFASPEQLSDNTTNNSTVRRRLNGTKRLYTEYSSELESLELEELTWKNIVDLLLDMLDDEHTDIREQACTAVCALVVAKIAVSSDLLARLILKWFSPLTEKHDQKLQYLIGHTFILFAKLEGTQEILEEAVIPVLFQIGNAPVISPLADIDLENALNFLSAVTSVRKETTFGDNHRNLALAVCSKIAGKPNDVCVPIYIKMLLHLELQIADPVALQELIHQVELLLEDITDKMSIKNLQQFLCNLKEMENSDNEETNDNSGNNGTHLESVNELPDTTNKEINNTAPGLIGTPSNNSKRQSSSNLNSCDNNELSETASALCPVSYSELTVFHTIAEDQELELGSLENDDLNIQTPSTSDSPNEHIISSSETSSRRLSKPLKPTLHLKETVKQKRKSLINQDMTKSSSDAETNGLRQNKRLQKTDFSTSSSNSPTNGLKQSKRLQKTDSSTSSSNSPTISVKRKVQTVDKNVSLAISNSTSKSSLTGTTSDSDSPQKNTSRSFRRRKRPKFLR